MCFMLMLLSWIYEVKTAKWWPDKNSGYQPHLTDKRDCGKYYPRIYLRLRNAILSRRNGVIQNHWMFLGVFQYPLKEKTDSSGFRAFFWSVCDPSSSKTQSCTILSSLVSLKHGRHSAWPQRISLHLPCLLISQTPKSDETLASSLWPASLSYH